MGDLKQRMLPYAGHGGEESLFTTRAEDLIAWGQKYSLFAYPFVTACCAMEYMAVASPRFDVARFGAEADPQTDLRTDRGAEMGIRLRHLRGFGWFLRQLRHRSRNRQDCAG
jgi:hypothetical protein